MEYVVGIGIALIIVNGWVLIDRVNRVGLQLEATHKLLERTRGQ